MQHETMHTVAAALANGILRGEDHVRGTTLSDLARRAVELHYELCQLLREMERQRTPGKDRPQP